MKPPNRSLEYKRKSGLYECVYTATATEVRNRPSYSLLSPRTLRESESEESFPLSFSGNCNPPVSPQLQLQLQHGHTK